MGNGVEFVKSCFDKSAKEIGELAASSEGFRDLCDDFAEANEEKKRWEQSPSWDRFERIAEYQELIDSMRVEIEREVEKTAAARFDRPRQ